MYYTVLLPKNLSFSYLPASLTVFNTEIFLSRNLNNRQCFTKQKYKTNQKKKQENDSDNFAKYQQQLVISNMGLNMCSFYKKAWRAMIVKKPGL